MQRSATIRRSAIAATVLALGLLAQPALAGNAANPLAGLSAVGQAELASLSGRQGISVSEQELVAVASGGTFEAGEAIETGRVQFGSGMQLHGLNNQAINTGNNANVLAGMTVHIHLH